MKKSGLFFGILLTFGLATQSYAQLLVGPRVAVNVSNVESELFNESLDTDSRLGYAFGAAVEYGVNSMVAVQAEVMYSQHGFKFAANEGGEITEFESSFNYLQVPILAKIKFGSNPAYYYVIAGPHLGFGMGDWTTEDVIDDETVKSTSSWEDAGVKTFDFGLTGGVGISFPAGPGNLGVDVRYQYGLINYSAKQMDNVNFVQNRNFQVGISYLIPIGGN